MTPSAVLRTRRALAQACIDREPAEVFARGSDGNTPLVEVRWPDGEWSLFFTATRAEADALAATLLDPEGRAQLARDGGPLPLP